MSISVKALAAALTLALFPATLPTVSSAQSNAGAPQVGTQQTLGNCDVIRWQSIVGRLVNNVTLPPNSRVIRLRNETSVAAVMNFDLSRLSVVTGRYGDIRRVYCG